MSDTPNENTPAAETAQTLAVNTTAPVAPSVDAPALNSTEGTQDAAAAGLAPTDDANATTQQPAATPADQAVALSVAESAIQAAAGLPSATVDAVDTNAIEPAPVPNAAHGGLMRELQEIEDHALFWGGELGVKIRNAVMRAREHAERL